MHKSILIVMLEQRRETAQELQGILSEAGCFIKTRLGLHETGENCADYGTVILELTGTPQEIKSLEERIGKIPRVKAKLVEMEL